MKHSVAPQSRNAMWSTFFCAVWRVIGILKALGFGRIALLDIARAKAVLLGLGKNPGVSVDAPTPPSSCRWSRGSVSTANLRPSRGSTWVLFGLPRLSPPLVLDQRDRGRGPCFHDRFKCFLECLGTALLDVSFASTFVAEALTTLTLSFSLIFLVSSGGGNVDRYFIALHRFGWRCRWRGQGRHLHQWRGLFMYISSVGFQGGEDRLAHACGSRPSVPVSGFVVVHAFLEKFKRESRLEYF
jgi:hypothetical protein